MAVSIRTSYEVEQRSDEWHALRLGTVTASTVGRLLTPTLRVADNDTSRATLMTLAAERATGWSDWTPTTTDMLRGVLDEPLARDLYASTVRAPVTTAGFITYEDPGIRIGYSPDGLVGDDGIIEIKSRRPRTQMSTILAGTTPDDCMAQMQCGLLVTGRAWCDYVSYAGGMPLWVCRVYPEPRWHEAILAAAAAAEETVTTLVATYRDAVRGLPVAERIDHFAEIEV